MNELKKIDMGQVIETANTAIETVKTAMADKSFPKIYDTAFCEFEGQALRFTEYNLSSKPHPDIAEAQFALWLAAAATAAHAGAMSRALYAVKMSMASGPVEEDYTLIAAIEDHAKAKISDANPEDTVELPEMNKIMQVVTAHLEHQRICTPVIDLVEYPPVADAHEIHLQRFYGPQLKKLHADDAPALPIIHEGQAVENIMTGIEAVKNEVGHLARANNNTNENIAARLNSLTESISSVIDLMNEVVKMVGDMNSRNRNNNQNNHK